MKRMSLLVCLLFLLAGPSFSQDYFISKDKAQIVAEKFCYERSSERIYFSRDKIKAFDNYTVEVDGQILYYVFNLYPEGFVAVAGYKNIMPVLFYSFNGKYDPDHQPDNFKAWTAQYQRQISYALSTKAEGSNEISALWEYYLTTPAASFKPFAGREVLPMLTSNWDQGTYYNAMCPADPAGPAGHCVTGCVATALGQLLNYFRWPETGTGSYSYECPPYGTLSADFENSAYEWDLMENNLGHANSEVAEILHHLGVSVDMVYGPDGSGMYNHKAAYTLKTYFKYSPETQYVFRDSTTMDWDSLIVAHLDRNIPLYYAGWSVPNLYGHAFICDGYQGENYYHFNWGWGGELDGYFYTENLTPGGNNFNLAQELVINAVPDTNLYTYPVHCQGEKEYDVLSGTLDDGSGPMYPYANGSQCGWLIVPNDTVNGITLNFNRFELEPNDMVTVYDGTDTSAAVLGEFSGNELPTAVTSTGGSMYIRFTSNSESVANGFLASFESEIPVFCSGNVTIHEQTGNLSDGSGNWNYHDNAICRWWIMPEGASSVTLFFTEFETEAGFDLLKIYDLQTQQLIAEYSGTYPSGLPDPVTSPSGKMFLTWTTNSMNTAPGWTAYFESNLVGIKENDQQKNLKVFPNPAKSIVTLLNNDIDHPVKRIELTDLWGRTVYSSEPGLFASQSFSIELSRLTSGIYVLSVSFNEGNIEYYRIVKE
jgi:hypothetical protein